MERRAGIGLAIWVAAVAVLIALPCVVFATRGHTAPVQLDSLSASAKPSPSPSPSPSAAVAVHKPAPLTVVPLCSFVWQLGKKVPADYAGCQSSGVRYSAGIVDKCLATWDGDWWARLGGRAHQVSGKLQRNRGYRRALSTLCS